MRKFFVGLAAVTLTVTLSACTSESEVSAPVASPAAEASAPPTEVEASPLDGERDVTTLPRDVIQSHLFETLTDSQQAELLAMDNMSVAEFRQLPVEEQLKYGYFVYDNNIDILKYRFDKSEQTQFYEGVNFDTASGMQLNRDVKFALLSSLKTLSPEAGIVFQQETALKASIIVNHGVDPIRQQNIDDQIGTWNLNTPSILTPVLIVEAVTRDNGETIANELDTKTQELSQVTYQVIDVQLVNGESRKDGIATLVVRDDDPRFKSSLR
jgi:hypothetical protein